MYMPINNGHCNDIISVLVISEKNPTEIVFRGISIETVAFDIFCLNFSSKKIQIDNVCMNIESDMQN